jgi:SAM-dependent methyltransferase
MTETSGAEAPSQWDKFYENSKDRPLRQLLLDSMAYVKPPGKALDIGAGALKESRYLLDQGFEVTAFDSEPAAAEIAKTILDDKFRFQPASYWEFKYPQQEYDLVTAMYALPFTPPEQFDEVMRNVLDSVKPGGIFAGHFFGEQDEWNNRANNMSFVSEPALHKFFEGFDELSFCEQKGEDSTDSGGMKFWHIYHLIARKH